MNKVNWVHMPHPAHFILSRDCRFVLSTYVGGYIVSTVGELWSDRQIREIHAQIYDKKWFIKNKHLKGDVFDINYLNKFGYTEIGMNRTYETMVFKSMKSKDKCCPYQINVTEEVDFKGYKNAADALIGHKKLCKKWSKKKKVKG